jgi:hypothetical protein
MTLSVLTDPYRLPLFRLGQAEVMFLRIVGVKRFEPSTPGPDQKYKI